MKNLMFKIMVLTGLSSLVSAAVLLEQHPSLAQLAELPVPVDAEVPVMCTLEFDGAPALSFGLYRGEPKDAEIDIRVACNSSGPYDLTLDDGRNPIGCQRQMIVQSETINATLPYDIYQDSSRTSKLECGNGLRLNFPLEGGTEIVTLYGRIPASSTLPTAGNYQDTLRVRISGS